MGDLGRLLTQLDEHKVRRGRQFERICKGFLTNDPLYQHQVRRVWLWDEWPGRWGADAYGPESRIFLASCGAFGL